MKTEHEPAAAAAGSGDIADGRRVTLVFLGIAAVLFVVSAVGSIWLPDPGSHVIPPFDGWRWLHGWAQWDSGWYSAIAGGGYGYIPGRQSTIAFFPAYPLAIRYLSALVGGPLWPASC